MYGVICVVMYLLLLHTLLLSYVLWTFSISVYNKMYYYIIIHFEFQLHKMLECFDKLGSSGSTKNQYLLHLCQDVGSLDVPIRSDT